jgi:hypothetical protein
MAKHRAVDTVGKLVALLEPIAPEDRKRVIQAAFTLLGEEALEGAVPPGAPAVGTSTPRMQIREKEYFDQKAPQTKIEELAVGARYREEREGATTHSRDGLRAVIIAARRNFDARNFGRDLANARVAGLFTRGTGRDEIILSAFGQSYVDTLPKRDELKQLRRHQAIRRRTPHRGKKGKTQQGPQR